MYDFYSFVKKTTNFSQNNNNNNLKVNAIDRMGVGLLNIKHEMNTIKQLTREREKTKRNSRITCRRKKYIFWLFKCLYDDVFS